MGKSCGLAGVLFAVAIFLFAEYGLVHIYLAKCSWPEADPKDLHALVISDPHLLGRRNGIWIDRFRRERQMHSLFQSSVRMYKPELVIVVGDLMDEGKWSPHEEWEQTVERFNRIFAVPKEITLLPVVGNHDIGFHESTRKELVDRYEKAFGSAVEMRTIKNITFVAINSIAFVDNCSICTDSQQKLDNITTQLDRKLNGRKKSLKKRNGMPVPPILLSHFPLFRSSEDLCLQQDARSITKMHMLDEKRKFWLANRAKTDTKQSTMNEASISNKPGFDVLTADVSRSLIKALKPRFVFSGHTHNHCTYVQPLSRTPELTVSTFNWRHRHDPSFVLSVISQQVDRRSQDVTIGTGSHVEGSNVNGIHRDATKDNFYFEAGGVRSIRCTAPDEAGSSRKRAHVSTPNMRNMMSSTRVALRHANTVNKNIRVHATFNRGLASSIDGSEITPSKTALYDLHVENGAKFATFAGWSMPMSYSDMGALESHHHTRKSASIFDVSHMLQLSFTGPNRIKFIERLVVGDVAGLKKGNGTLSLMTNQQGGIIDDCVVTNAGDHIYMVANAGCAEKDLEHIRGELKEFNDGGVDLEVMHNYSLIALQGPKAAEALSRHVETSEINLDRIPFMGSVDDVHVCGVSGCRITRCGYTGEDGFEISIPNYKAVCVTRRLLSEPEVAFAGLGARDSLRLEAGLCLYGNDIDESTTPMEANLVWTVGKRRREEGGFVGSDIILEQIKKKSGIKRRVGITVEGAPARAHSTILDMEGNTIGEVTSGVPSPTLGKNVAMAYINKPFNKSGTEVQVQVRKRVQKAIVTKMPFVKCNYYKPT
eukprot:CFRG5686T1